MGYLNAMPPAYIAQWKLPAALTLIALLTLPAWHSHYSTPKTGALSKFKPLIDETTADTLIVYAAPVDADPVLRISSRDTNGNWQESELQLSHENPDLSARLLKAAVSRGVAELSLTH